MTLNIVLPHQRNFAEWLCLYSPFNNHFKESFDVSVNFANVTFIEPKHIVLLSCYLEIYYKNNKIISFNNVRPNIKLYLIDIGFFKYFDIYTPRTGYSITTNNSTIPLWNIQPAETFQYSIYAQDFLQRNYLKNADLIFIQSNLDEIFNNIADHSGCLINGYVLTQMYPNLNKIVFSVCDLGIGIPNSINFMLARKNQMILSDCAAIEHSTIARVSSKSKPHNMGMGLNSIVNLCHDDLGTVDIYSNKGYYTTAHHIPNIDREVPFVGTLINITIDTNKVTFNDLEELEVLNF